MLQQWGYGGRGEDTFLSSPKISVNNLINPLIDTIIGNSKILVIYKNERKSD